MDSDSGDEGNDELMCVRSDNSGKSGRSNNLGILKM